MELKQHDQKIKNVKNTLIKIVKYISIYKYKLIISLIFGLCSTVLNIIAPKFVAKIVNELYDGVVLAINGLKVNVNIGYINKIILILLILCVVGNILLYLQGVLMADISVKLTYKLRQEMDQKINKLPISYFDKMSNGEVLSRLTNDVYTMTSTLSSIVTRVVTVIITIIGIIIMMYTINWICATVALVIIPITYFIIQFIIKKSQRFFNDQQKFIGETSGYIEEIYSQHNIVKAFNAEEDSMIKFGQINEKLYMSSWKASFFSSLLTPIIFFFGNINYLLVIVTASILALNGLITVGDIQAFVSYVKSLNQPMSSVANITSIFQRIIAASERIFEFLEESEEEPDKDVIKLPSKIRGDICFDNVSFGYKKGNDVIKNVSFSAKSGQKIAFVGATGSGKTTIVKLLMRFYEIDEGAIYIDDINIKNFSRKDLRSIFSMVLQNAWIYSGTIEDNIKYGNFDASDRQIKLAAKMAYADKFIETLPQGYKTTLNDEATNISYGEKQLITIARAMIADSPILILDEATSSVDIKTEGLIQKAIDNIMKEKTCFIIAHRLSTIRNADVIFVMGNGKILESGTHDELIKIKGHYANIYNSQFQF